MLRRATLDDAPAIAAIHVRAWQAAYAGIVPADFLAGLSIPKRTEFWQRELTENRSIVVVAIERGSIVGWASGGTCRDADATDESEIFAVYVSPECWARGVGRQLMTRIEEDILPFSAITLWVLTQNQRAIAFYRKIGYEFDGAEKSLQFAGVSLQEVRLRKANA